MPLVDHFGCLKDAENNESVGDVIVRLVPKDETQAAPKPDLTDKNGAFHFAQVDDSQEWTLVSLKSTGEKTLDQKVDLKHGTTAESPAVYSVVFVSRIVNPVAGRLILVALIVVLAGMILFWLNGADRGILTRSSNMLTASARLDSLVQRETVLVSSDLAVARLDDLEKAIPAIDFPPKVATALDIARHDVAAMKLLQKPYETRTALVLKALGDLSDPLLADDWKDVIDKAVTADTEAATAKEDEVGSKNTKLKAESAKVAQASTSVAAAKGYVAVLNTTVLARTDKTPPVERLKNEKKLFLTQLERVQNVISDVAVVDIRERDGNSPQLFDWRVGTNIVWTVLFWGFVGSTVRLIMDIQRYLRFGVFYERGIYQHAALFFAVPILAASFVKLASMVSIQSTSSELELNFADPQIMAVGAFLLALSPWNLWERLLNLSKGVSSKTS